MERYRRLASLGCGVAFTLLLLALGWARERAERAKVAREADAAATQATEPQPAALRVVEPCGCGTLEVRLVDA